MACNKVGRNPETVERYMKLALKAQSQCRSTLQAISKIKNPMIVGYVRQANVAYGPQQVNNMIQENELLDADVANGWTLERRQKQSAAIQRWKPWERSTDPKTPEGKARSAANADKGLGWHEIRELRHVLRVNVRRSTVKSKRSQTQPLCPLSRAERTRLKTMPEVRHVP